MAKPYSDDQRARAIAIVGCRALRHEVAGLFEASPSLGDQLVLALAMTTALQRSRVACKPQSPANVFLDSMPGFVRPSPASGDVILGLNHGGLRLHHSSRPAGERTYLI
jgi:hypothetical protein